MKASSESGEWASLISTASLAASEVARMPDMECCPVLAGRVFPNKLRPPAKTPQKREGENVRAARTWRRWPGRSRKCEGSIARSWKLEARGDQLKGWKVERLEEERRR